MSTPCDFCWLERGKLYAISVVLRITPQVATAGRVRTLANPLQPKSAVSQLLSWPLLTNSTQHKKPNWLLHRLHLLFSFSASGLWSLHVRMELELALASSNWSDAVSLVIDFARSGRCSAPPVAEISTSPTLFFLAGKCKLRANESVVADRRIGTWPSHWENKQNLYFDCGVREESFR